MPSGDARKAAARPAFERVLERVVRDEDGCWIWPGAVAGPKGHKYGRFRVGSRSDGTRRTEQTHRVVWESMVGPIPEGIELDHLCRVTRCCNPGHLDPVTHQENMRRMQVSEAGRAGHRRHIRRVNQRRWGAAA